LDLSIARNWDDRDAHLASWSRGTTEKGGRGSRDRRTVAAAVDLSLAVAHRGCRAVPRELRCRRCRAAVAGVDLSAAVAVQPWLPRRTSRALVPMMPSRRQPRQCTSKKNRRGSPAVDVTVADAPAAVPPRSPCAACGQGAWPASNNACSSPAAVAQVPAERILEWWSQRERWDGAARSDGDEGLSTRCSRRTRGMAPPAEDPAALATSRA